jgi:serine/threonine protein phosphatase 1
MRTLVIGDIHGCFVELNNLLEKAGLASDDAIIALGDIVDRGPETPEVLEFFRQQASARSLMGNHERKHVRSYRGELKPALSQMISKLQLGAAYPDAVAFMDTFPVYLELPEAILVHGFVEPGVPLDQQLPTVLCGTMGGEHYLSARYSRPWYELYDHGKPVLFGHHDLTENGQPFIYQDRAYGLDTSCVLGKTLTGLILPDFQIVSVPSRGNHWSLFRQQYRSLKPTAPPTRRISKTETWSDESEKALQKIVDFAIRENARVLAYLRERPGFAELTSRQQAKTYAAEIGNTPIAPLLHLARKGELNINAARRILKDPLRAKRLAKEQKI